MAPLKITFAQMRDMGVRSRHLVCNPAYHLME